MLIIAGTIPIKNMPLISGTPEFENNQLIIGDYKIPVGQGTSSLIFAAYKVIEFFKTHQPCIVVAGDIGYGDGTKNIYNYLIENINILKPNILTLHYCLPIMKLIKNLIDKIENNRLPTKIIADASSMYAAKAAGLSKKFEIFTPDMSELSFLSDKDAVHPAFMRKHLFVENENIKKLIKNAYEYNNAPSYLIIKGKTDYIIKDGEIVETISDPNIPAMEAIGGTGDTITGLLSGFIESGFDTINAIKMAAIINRLSGIEAKVTVASKITELINVFDNCLKKYFNKCV